MNSELSRKLLKYWARRSHGMRIVVKRDDKPITGRVTGWNVPSGSTSVEFTVMLEDGSTTRVSMRPSNSQRKTCEAFMRAARDRKEARRTE